MLQYEFHNVDSIENSLFKYAIIVSRYQGQWIFCKHRERDTWEFPAGTREPGELISDTAKRELYEETGALDFDLHAISAFSINGDYSVYSFLCFAEIETLGPLPRFEIRQIRLFHKLPAPLTYPVIQPILFEKVKAWLLEN